MSQWTHLLSYAIFYHAVYAGNTNYHQYENTSILINGIRLNVDAGMPKEAMGQAQASRLCSGLRPVTKAKASELGGLPDAELERRIHDTSIIDIDQAANCLVGLLRSEHIRMDETRRRTILELTNQNNPTRLIAAVFRIAVACPKEMLIQLTEEIEADIDAYRQQEKPEQDIYISTAEEETPEPEKEIELHTKDEPFHYNGTMSGFTIAEMDFAKHEAMIRKALASVKGNPVKRRMKEEDILSCLDLARQSEAVYLLLFDGALEALIDILIHRIDYRQCLEIAMIGRVHSEKAFQKMRNMLTNIAYYAVAENGRLFVSYGIDAALREDEYDFTVIYSVNDLSQNQRQKVSIALDDILEPLEPWYRFEGRVPEFLAPPPERK